MWNSGSKALVAINPRQSFLAKVRSAVDVPPAQVWTKTVAIVMTQRS